MDDNLAKAKKIISQIIYITIASVTPDGKPWNTPVYSAFDERYNFFWVSWRENQHSQNVRANPNVFLVIYDSTVAESSGEGVYIQATAHELTDPNEIERALKYLYGRKNKSPRSAQEFLGEYPRRVYQAIPEKFWLNIGEKIEGNYIDKRVEVKLI